MDWSSGELVGVTSRTEEERIGTRSRGILMVHLYERTELEEWVAAREAGDGPLEPVPVWQGRAMVTEGDGDVVHAVGAMMGAMLTEAPLR